MQDSDFLYIGNDKTEKVCFDLLLIN